MGTRKLLGAALLLTSLAGVALPAYADAPDQSGNSMMWGGCFTKQACINVLENGDGKGGHSASELQSVYASQGITIDSFRSSDMKEDGMVTKTGDVWWNGTKVATGAESFGRDFVSGSTKVGSLYERSTSTVFLQSQLQAFVIMHNKTFVKAVLKSCGNVVVATPVAMASKTVTKTITKTVTKPAPAPTINVVQNQSQVQVQAQTQTQTQAAPAPTPTAPTSTPPTTPAATVIPQTGAAAGAGLAGVSAVFIVAWYWLRSRRGLRFALKRGA